MTVKDYGYLIRTDAILKEHGFDLYCNTENDEFEILDRNEVVVYNATNLEIITAFLIGYLKGVEQGGIKCLEK